MEFLINFLETAAHLCGLFLEGIQDAVDQLFLQSRVDVRRPQIAHDLLDGLHHHLPVLFRLILQIIHDPLDNLRSTHFVGNLYCRVYQLQNRKHVNFISKFEEIPSKS